MQKRLWVRQFSVYALVCLPVHTVNKQKFNRVKFKGLIGFIKRFLNWAASHLASREEF